MNIIFARFLNSRICPPREIRENQNLAKITRSTASRKFGNLISQCNNLQHATRVLNTFLHYRIEMRGKFYFTADFNN